jgi:hypothetical protein
MLSPAKSLKCFPLTLERWDDFATLFGHNGACGGCWCMFWRLKRPDFLRGKGDGNKNAIHQLVKAGISRHPRLSRRRTGRLVRRRAARGLSGAGAFAHLEAVRRHAGLVDLVSLHPQRLPPLRP